MRGGRRWPQRTPLSARRRTVEGNGPCTMTPDIKRIAVYGPESTGKTELATKLAAHFAAPLVTEYARERWDAQGALTLEDMLPIAKEQWRREDEAVRRVCHLMDDKLFPLVICDTDALTTMLWSDLLYGTTPDELRRGAEKRELVWRSAGRRVGNVCRAGR